MFAKICGYKDLLACMSWPCRPNTWEKGLRLQVSVSSMVELLCVCGGETLSLLQANKVHRGSTSTCSLCWLLMCLPLMPLHDLSYAFSQRCHSLRPVSWSVAPDQELLLLLLLLLFSWWEMCAPRLLSLSLLISAPVWRCFRWRAQHEQSKREGIEQWAKEEPAAERRHKLYPPTEGEQR